MDLQIASPSPADEIALWRKAYPRIFAAPLGERWARRALIFVLACVFAFGLLWIEASPARLCSGLSRLGLLVKLMLPPTSGGYLGSYLKALVETLAMALVGTTIAVLVALPLGFLAARNIIPGLTFHFALRRVLDMLRGIDILIWALIFVSAVGMGPFAGVLAIIFSDVAFLSKLFAEAVENIDRRPVDGVRAAGANTIETVRFAVLPQITPIVLSNALYFFESNFRSASVLGIVGAGGIGLQLSQRIMTNEWDQACFIIVIMLVAVAMIDVASRQIRARIIGDLGNINMSKQ
ncbi:phosphonate ABC transporter, permease protein PhnE [Bradyrhizobium tunisiense]|uniref:phosphonate ABC transporter, permease protein PhnE n=1 Tax=Bradyrhizobium tunisiense TaxID=3278709 RepID=UPI0035E1E918